MTKNMIALDCGNSSFRVVLGVYDGERVVTQVLLQTEHDMVNILGFYYWDILKIYDGLITGIKKACGMVSKIDSIGICTWGIDFALYRDGFMLSNPLSYRNTIGEICLRRLTAESRRDLFFKTGILCDKINSAYMLMGIREHMGSIYHTADRLLMVPDIFNYMLTGKMCNEPSELSTTQLMDVQNMEISSEVCSALGLSDKLFCQIGRHGTKIGELAPSVKSLLEIDYDIPVVCVPSHDTAAAVLAIPAQEEEFAFISSGTWSLIGTELQKPIITDAVRESCLTNEVGAFGKITLLKNSAGMFIIQRIRKELNAETKQSKSWDEIVNMARSYSGRRMTFDVNDIRFFNPQSMSGEIFRYLQESGQARGAFDWCSVIRAVYESMADSYAAAFAGLEKVTGKHYNKIYIVGGGSQNGFLNELAAERTQKTVVACGKESTSYGNLAAQIKYFEPEKTVGDIRAILGHSIEPVCYAKH